MTTEDHNAPIPEGYKDFLESTALVHVATPGPDGEHLKFSQTKPRHTTQLGS